jgi:hypothetical protein
VILDTKGNIFGGFTPVEWESRAWHWGEGYVNQLWKTDDSQKSFIFTLKNPHNISARKFALKPEMKHRALHCDSKWGPCFSGIDVSDNCNTNAESHTYLGWTYINDTGLDPKRLFTGSEKFKVKEIEVFEIKD